MSNWDRENVVREIDERVAAQVVKRDRSVEFEVLSSELVLSNTGLTAEEIEAGVVGGSRDGGLDGVHIFVNGELLGEDSDYFEDPPTVPSTLRNPSIVVDLVQAKESAGFSETAVILAAESASKLLDPDRDTDSLRGTFSDEVLEVTGRFVRVLDVLRTRHPTVDIRFTYCSTGDSSNLHPNVVQALRDFETKICAQVYGATSSATALGASNFVAFLRRRPTYDGLQLVVEELMPHERDGGDPSWITLVTLGNYIKFLTDENGGYRDYLFTENVRAYDRNTPVNSEIEKTLRDEHSPEFWWLNNGVTIIGAKVTAPGKRLAIDDVQIVNGLQTSETIWQVLHSAKPTNPLLAHRVLVRVIPTTDKKVRNKIIRATNAQTPVRAEGLRATDDVQLQIEEFLLDDGYYYDRRRNYYKNMGKPRARIVGIRQLAQDLLTWTKFRPDDARARPNDYLTSNARHDFLFSPLLPREIFSWVIDAQTTVENYLARRTELDAAARNDLGFLVASVASESVVDRARDVAQKLVDSGPASSTLSDARVGAAYRKVLKAIDAAQQADPKARRDQLVKNATFVESVLKRKRQAKPTASPK
ncbi:AIPR family protein [Herbiconiux sp. P15]|uniref:AIPR family protein n=1 Tax=Herbiconiux liukaitaii TaxID=3342799 RepID=UPI0035B990EF